MDYDIDLRTKQALVTYTREGAPKEVCGLLFGERTKDGIVEFGEVTLLPNLAKDPIHTFEISGSAFRLAYETCQCLGIVLGIWHSHPDSRPTPSKADFSLISLLVDIPFIIVGGSPPVIKIFEVAELGRVREAYRGVLL